MFLKKRVEALEAEVKTLKELVFATQEDFNSLRALVEEAVLPDDSKARKAKEEIDKFNAGIYNVLTYDGTKQEGNV